MSMHRRRHEAPAVTEKRRSEILLELCLTEDDLDYMGDEQRELVEDVVARMVRNRQVA